MQTAAALHSPCLRVSVWRTAAAVCSVCSCLVFFCRGTFSISHQCVMCVEKFWMCNLSDGLLHCHLRLLTASLRLKLSVYMLKITSYVINVVDIHLIYLLFSKTGSLYYHTCKTKKILWDEDFKTQQKVFFSVLCFWKTFHFLTTSRYCCHRRCSFYFWPPDLVPASDNWPPST